MTDAGCRTIAGLSISRRCARPFKQLSGGKSRRLLVGKGSAVRPVSCDMMSRPWCRCGSQTAIYAILRARAEKGERRSVVSSDLEEVMIEHADRIGVMGRGGSLPSMKLAQCRWT